MTVLPCAGTGLGRRLDLAGFLAGANAKADPPLRPPHDLAPPSAGVKAEPEEPLGNLPEGSASDDRRTTTKVARAVGMGRPTFRTTRRRSRARRRPGAGGPAPVRVVQVWCYSSSGVESS